MEQVVGIVVLGMLTLLALTVLKQSTYRVKYPHGAIVTLMGEIHDVVVTPGLKFKLPGWISLNGKPVMEVFLQPGDNIPFTIPVEDLVTSDNVRARFDATVTFRIIRDSPTKKDGERNRVHGLLNKDAMLRFYSFSKPENVSTILTAVIRDAATTVVCQYDSRRLPSVNATVKKAVDEALEARRSFWGVTFEVSLTDLTAPTTVAASEKVVAAQVEKEFTKARMMGEVEGYVDAFDYLMSHKPKGVTTEQWNDVVDTFLTTQKLKALQRGTNLSVFSGLNGLFSTLMGGAGDVVKARLDEKFGPPDAPGPKPLRRNPNSRARRRGP